METFNTQSFNRLVKHGAKTDKADGGVLAEISPIKVIKADL